MKLYKFYTRTCCQCKVLDRMLDGFDLMPIIPIDCAEDTDDLTTKYQIKSLPTLILATDEGDFVKRFTGLLTKEALAEELNKLEKDEIN